MKQIDKHRKAIKLLNAIAEAGRMMESHSKYLGENTGNDVGGLRKHHQNRFEVNKKIQDRLQNYYDKSFKI